MSDDRLPPHAPEAERGLLGCIIIDPANLFEASSANVDDRWFYDHRNVILWKAVLALGGGGKSWDLVALVTHLRDTGQFEAIGGTEYLLQVQDTTPSPANLPNYLEILAEKWRARRLLEVCSRTVAAIYDGETPPDEVVAKAQQGILAVTEQGSDEREKSLLQLMPDCIEILEAFAQGNKVMSGYTTGFNYLDNMMAGWEKGQMYVLAGRPSTGKTSLAVDILLNFCKHHGPAAFFSKEMTQMQVALRSLANYARQDFQTFRNGFIKDGDAPRLVQAAGELAGTKLFIDQSSGLNGQQILMRARRMMRQHDIKLVLIDYLQLMGSVEKYRERRDRIADASEWCKRIAKSLDVPVIALAQLNREVEKGGKWRPPQLSDLAECGDIEQDADFVGALYRPKIDGEILDLKSATIASAREQFRNMGDSESKREFYWLKHLDAGPDAEHELLEKHVSLVNLAVLKQRNGPTGDVGFVFYKRQMRFADAGRPT